MTLSEITLKINAAPHIDFGDIFNKAFALFQKVWLQGFLMVLLSFVSFMGLYVILFVPMMASSFVLEGQVDNGNEMVSILLMIVLFAFYLVIIVAATIANVGLQAAFYRIVRLKDRNLEQEQGVNFGMFFKKKYLKKLSIFSMAYMGIFILSYILCVLPVIYATVPLQFAIIIFAFHPEWTINDIFKTAFALGNKKWGVTFALLLVSGILAYVVGFIACVVGVYVTISFILLPAYLVYKEVVGFTEVEDTIAQIGGGFIE